jgi:CHAT domain-containing protein/Tfp pilus assembly protein PilF
MRLDRWQSGSFRKSTLRFSAFVAVTLAIAPTAIAPAAAQSIGQAIAQAPPENDLDQAIAEGMRLFRAGDADSLRKAIGQFEKALELARSAKVRDKQAFLLLGLGRINDLLGEKLKALKYYNQALPLSRAVGDRAGEVTTLTNIGHIYTVLGEKQKALEYYNQALRLRRAVGDRSGEARALKDIGLVYNALDEKQKALEYYNQALLLYRAVGDWTDKADTLNKIGFVYDALGEKQKALNYYNQSSPLWRAAGDQSGEATTLNNIGAVYSALGEKQKALGYYNQALPLLRAVGDQSGEAGTLNNIGRVYDALGEKQKALDYYNQVLPFIRAVGDRSGEAVTLNNIGLVYDALGEKQKALDYYNQALPISRTVGNRSVEAVTLNNIGTAYHDLGEKLKALDFYNQALPIRHAVGDRSGEATTLGNIGGVYSDLGEKQKALDYYNQALPIARAVGNRSGEATTLNNIGNIYSDLGEKPKALEFYNQALPIARTVGDRSGEATTLNNIGQLYSDLGDKAKGLVFLNQALPISRAVGDRSGEAITLNNIAVLLNKQQPDVAIVFYKQSVNIFEALRKDIRKLPRETQETYTKTVTSTYRRLADTLLAQGRIGEAQKVLELLKIKEINTVTEGTRSAPPLAQNQVALSQLEQEIITKYTSLADFGQQLHTCEQTKCPRFNEYNTQYQKLSKAYNQFIEDTKTQLANARLQEVDAGTKTFIANADRIVTAQPNTVLIYPLILPDKVRILWATKGGALDQAECPLGEAQIAKLTEQFRTALQTSDDLNPVQQTGQQLYNCLIPPKLQKVLTESKIDNLIFVPDRITNYIPMSALHDSHQYLIEKYSVTNILAASYTDTTDRLPKNPTILGFGLSQAVTLTNPTRYFGELRYVPLELNAILNPPGPSPHGIGHQWLDRDFTRDRLTTALLDKPNILHIATHGEFVPTDPRTSYLVLGDGTPYPTSDIQYLRNLANVHLVVLSACETALGGRDRNGLEIAGIGAYFLGDPSKAKAVLASLWKVNDPATTLLMSDFYATLNKGHFSKTQALRQVQLKLLNSKLTLQDAANRAGARRYEPNKKRPQNLSHPYYWAPFILIGNGL